MLIPTIPAHNSAEEAASLTMLCYIELENIRIHNDCR